MNEEIDDIPQEQSEELYERRSFVIDKGQEPMRIDKWLQIRLERATRNKIQNGIDVNQLKETVQKTINTSIETANYNKMLLTAKEIQVAVTQATQTLKDYEKEVKSISTWQTGILVGSLCFVFGAACVWAVQYSRIDKYQYAIDQTDAMAGYINSSCNIKQNYAKFVGQTIDCEKNWASPTSILSSKK